MAPLDASRGKTQSYTSLFNFGTDQQSHCQPGRTGRVPSFVSSSDLNRQNYQTQPEPNQFQTMPFYFPSREPEPHDIAVHDHDPKNFLQRQYHSPEANVWSNASADLKSTGYDCYQCAVLNSQRYANEAPMASSQPWMYGQASGFKFESLVDRLQHGAMQPYPLMVSGPLLQAHTPPTSQNDFTGSEATVDSPYTNSLHASLDEGSYLLTDNTHQPVSYLRGVSPSTAPSSVPSPGEAHAVMSKKAEPLKIPASKRVNSAHNLLSHAGSHTALEESRKRTTQQAAAAAAAKDEPYAKLIEKALLSRPNYTMSLQDIYQWFCDNTNKIKNEGTGWRNSIRHNLSMNAAFSKLEARQEEESGGASQEVKRSTEWVLADWAVKKGVQSTTRYRKTNASRRAARARALGEPYNLQLRLPTYAAMAQHRDAMNVSLAQRFGQSYTRPSFPSEHCRGPLGGGAGAGAYAGAGADDQYVIPQYTYEYDPCAVASRSLCSAAEFPPSNIGANTSVIDGLEDYRSFNPVASEVPSNTTLSQAAVPFEGQSVIPSHGYYGLQQAPDCSNLLGPPNSPLPYHWGPAWSGNSRTAAGWDQPNHDGWIQ